MLRISDNGRFLVHEDSRPFFYLGDTAWELFHRRDFLSFEYTGTTGPNGAMPHVPGDWHIALLKTYKEAAPLMNSPSATRRILPDEQGVEYNDGMSRVLWTFEEVTVEVSEETTFTDLRDGSTFTAQTSTVLPKHGVFQIKGLV